MTAQVFYLPIQTTISPKILNEVRKKILDDVRKKILNEVKKKILDIVNEVRKVASQSHSI